MRLFRARFRVVAVVRWLAETVVDSGLRMHGGHHCRTAYTYIKCACASPSPRRFTPGYLDTSISPIYIFRGVPSTMVFFVMLSGFMLSLSTHAAWPSSARFPLSLYKVHVFMALIMLEMVASSIVHGPCIIHPIDNLSLSSITQTPQNGKPLFQNPHINTTVVSARSCTSNPPPSQRFTGLRLAEGSIAVDSLKHWACTARRRRRKGGRGGG